MKLYEGKKHFDELLTESGNSRRASRQIVKVARTSFHRGNKRTDKYRHLDN